MTSLTKVVFALLLLAGGFVAAKTFGPPELAKRLADSWRPATQPQWNELRPASPSDQHAQWLPPLDAMEMPAPFSAPPSPQQQQPAAPSSLAASGPAGQRYTTAKPQTPPPAAWPEMPALGGEPTSHGDVFHEPAVQTSSFEEEMVDLRHYAAPPAVENAPQREERDNRWPSAPVVPAKEVSANASGAAPPDPPPIATAPAPPLGFSDFAAAPPVDAWNPARQQTSRLSAGAIPPAPPRSARTHIVADGDSLPKLAQRYLGDAARSSEIYEQNRELLTHPDLLPLGVELKLP